MAQPDAGDRRRYNDRDVRADWKNLYALATRYLREYWGDFHPLRTAKNLISEGGYLELEQVRVVLNCMIHDSNVVNMPEPIGHTLKFDAAETGGQVLAFPSGEDVTDDLDKLPGRRPNTVICKSSVHTAKPYWYSLQKNAYLIHIVKEVTVRYRTERFYDNCSWWEGVPEFINRFEVRPRMLCGQENYGVNRNKRAAAPEEIEGLIADGRKWCRPCVLEYEAGNPTTPLPGTAI